MVRSCAEFILQLTVKKASIVSSYFFGFYLFLKGIAHVISIDLVQEGRLDSTIQIEHFSGEPALSANLI